MSQYAKYIFVIFLIITLAFKFWLLDINKGLWWDEAVYLTLGRNLLAGEYGMNVFMERFRPPLFPFLVALTSFGGEISVRLMVFVFYFLAVFATYYLGKTLHDKNVGYFAASFLITSPLFIFFGQKILAESVYVTFFALALTTFFLGMKKPNRLLLCGFFTGLAVITKWYGFSLFIIYFLFLLLRRNFAILKKAETLTAICIFFLTLIPVFLIGAIYYGNPVGGILENLEIFGASPTQPFYFYFVNLFKIFALPLVLLVAGFFFSLRNLGNAKILILISSLLPFFVLSAMAHKELRYFVLFLPAFSCLAAVGMANLCKIKYKQLVVVTIFLVLSAGFLYGYIRVIGDSSSGEALKLGARSIMKLTAPDEVVMSESYPFINYYAKRVAIRPPPTKEEFHSHLEMYNITYVLVYVFEPGNPDYILDELEKTGLFEEVESFTQWGQKAVIIYKKIF